MNRTLADKVVQAVLYEGYMLYPYRPSVKNRQRWTFGGVYPEAWSRAQNGSDAWMMQTECLVAGGDDATVEVGTRFLHLTDRTVGKLADPLAHWPVAGEPAWTAVEVLTVGDKQFQTWQEATEREIAAGEFRVGELRSRARERAFHFPGNRTLEPVSAPDGAIVGVLVREQQSIQGTVELSAVPVAEGLHRLTIRVVNRTLLADASGVSRDQAVLRALVSTHTILGVRGGAFVSLTDPPEPWREMTAACRNVGTWPVLIGTGTEKDAMLSAPIILYDYPQIAPESPGDLFDATEIDEILTLRILTLTDDEKRAAADVDERTSELLARTQALARQQLMGLHGTMRGLQAAPTEERHECE
jgi:hypothetical protein